MHLHAQQIVVYLTLQQQQYWPSRNSANKKRRKGIPKKREIYKKVTKQKKISLISPQFSPLEKGIAAAIICCWPC